VVRWICGGRGCAGSIADVLGGWSCGFGFEMGNGIAWDILRLILWDFDDGLYP
jgi:hypothetical protein